MILYESDWIRADGRPAAVIHYQTRNPTFLRMTDLLQRLGVKNRFFHMALLQPELAEVDPHDPNLTAQQKLMVAAECRYNVWYYLREVVRIPADGSDVVPFELNRSNLAMTWCFFNHIDYTSTQPRQTGKTMGAIALSSYVMFVFGYNINISMFAHNSTLVHENVGRLKEIRDGLPSYLVDLRGKFSDNKEGLAYAPLKNNYKTYVGQKDKRAAANIGRGDTASVIHVDEIGHIFNIAISFPVLMNSTSRAVDNARRAGQPHSNLYTTTAADTSTSSGKYAFDLVNGAMPFSERLYDLKGNAELRARVRANSTNGLINGTFSYLQLGKTHEWFIEKTTRSNTSQDEIERDYLNIWKAGSSATLLPKEIISILNTTKAEPSYVQSYGEYAISWYLPMADVESPSFCRRQFVLGMDTARNIGRDFTAMVLIDPADLRVVATFRCNESNMTTLGVFVGEFLVRFSNTLFVPENNGPGGAVIDSVMLKLIEHKFNPFLRIFNAVVQNREAEEYRDINIHDAQYLVNSRLRRHLGFTTTAGSRETLYKEILIKALRINAARVFDSTVIDELVCLVVTNGRTDHSDGGHDDMVIALLLACYAVLDGRNLSTYGITEAMTGVSTSGSRVDPQHRAAQLQLRAQLQNLTHLLRKTNNPAVRQMFQIKIDQLQSMIDDTIADDPIARDQIRQQPDAYKTPYGRENRPEPMFGGAQTPSAMEEIMRWY